MSQYSPSRAYFHWFIDYPYLCQQQRYRFGITTVSVYVSLSVYLLVCLSAISWKKPMHRFWWNFQDRLEMIQGISGKILAALIWIQDFFFLTFHAALVRLFHALKTGHGRGLFSLITSCNHIFFNLPEMLSGIWQHLLLLFEIHKYIYTVTPLI